METAPPTLIEKLRIRKWNEIADTLERILNRLVAGGIHIDDSSRLRQYVKLMREEGSSLEDRARLELMSQIRSDADEIVNAVEHLSATPEVPGWQRLFERIKRGPLFPAPFDDKAREAQVELFLGAVMRSTGAEVSFAGADAQAVYREHLISFEAKRPSSLTNYGHNVKGGRNQLGRAGGTGVLFLDLSQLATEHARVNTVSSYDEAMKKLAPPLLDSLERLR